MNNLKKRQKNQMISLILTLSLVITTALSPLPGFMLETHAAEKVITTADELLQGVPEGEVCELGADITLESGQQIPMIAGTLDGKGHVVTLTDMPMANEVTGTIQNIGVCGKVKEGDNYGTIAMNLSGKLYNSYSVANLNVIFKSGGGLVGTMNENAEISNCYFAGGLMDVDNYGIALRITSPKVTIRNCYSHLRNVCAMGNGTVIDSGKKTKEEMKTPWFVDLMNVNMKDTGFKWALSEGTFPVLKEKSSESETPVVADKTALNNKIAEVMAMDKTKYTYDTWAKVEEALLAAQTLASKDGVSQVEVDIALQNLTTAINNLEKALPLQPVKFPDDTSQIVKVTEESQLRNTEAGKYYQLQNDISSNGSTEEFNGILDGNGHTITLNGKALFQNVGKEGIIQNVHFAGTVGTTYDVAGPLGRLVKGAILNCSSAVSGDSAVGFTKRLENGVISNCIAYGKAGNGALLNAYGGINWGTGQEYKGKIYSSYWIKTSKDPAIDQQDLLDGSSTKTEDEMKTKNIVSLLNEKRGAYGTAWGQNGATGFPYFGEDQNYESGKVELPDSKYTIKFGKKSINATKIKDKKIDVSRYDLAPKDNRVIGQFFIEGLEPTDEVSWSVYDVTNDAISVNEDGQMLLYNEGEGIVKAQVNGQDAVWVKVFSNAREIEDIKLYIDEQDVTGKEHTVQGSQWTNILVKAKFKGETEYKDAYFEKFRFDYEKKELVHNVEGPEFSFAQPGTTKVTVTALDDKTKTAVANVTSEYVPISSIKPDVSDVNELHARSSMGDGRAFDAIETNGVIISPKNASNKAGFHVTSSNPSVAEFSPALPIGYLPFAPGKVTFTASIEDKNPVTGETKTLTGTRKVEFKYKNPLTEIKVNKAEVKVKEFETIPLDLQFTGAISKEGWSVTEPELIWTYEGDGAVEIGRENLCAQNREDEHPKDKGYWMATTDYKVKGLKEGTVVATGTPLDKTNSIAPVKLKITVTSGNAPDIDLSGMIKKAKDTSIRYILDRQATNGYKYDDEWKIYSLLRAGEDIPEDQLNQYYDSVLQKVKTWNQNVKPTDVAKVALALSAMGKDITNVGGVNLAELIYNSPKLTDGTNELCWALIALDARDTEVPENATWTRDKIIDELLTWQNKDGGYPLFAAGSSGIDTTAMVLQAFAEYKDRPEVEKSIEKGLTYLSKSVQSKFDAGNSEANAQIILTLSVLGKDPVTEKGFSTKYKNLITSLMEYFVDGQGFKHTKDAGQVNLMATLQALQGLDAYDHFAKNKENYWDTSKMGSSTQPDPQPNPDPQPEPDPQPQPDPEPQPKPEPPKKEGTVVLTVERFTVGQGYFIEPVRVPFKAGDNGATLLKKVIGAQNFIGEDVYLRGIKKADKGPDHTVIPEYITHMGKDAPTTQSARAYYESDGKTHFEKGTLGEGTYSPSSGWFYTLNGKAPEFGINDYEPKDNDVIRFQYTVYGYGADITGHIYGSEKPSVIISDKSSLTILLATVNANKTELLQDANIKKAYENAMNIMPDMTASQEKVDACKKALEEALKKTDIEVQPKPQEPGEGQGGSENPSGPQYFRPVVLTDKNTGIIMTGENLERNMNLKVTRLEKKDKQVSLMQSEVPKMQWIVRLNDITLMKNGSEVADHGKVTLYLPLSKVYTGSKMTVVHCVNGTVEKVQGEVVDGFVKIEVSDLQGFGIVIEAPSIADIYKKIA